ncbi:MULTISPECIES: polysaccharide deacetylase family protein [Methylobacterium]|uniref:polysaccharide deacetylase family protein n=1 Tax=Methylobacterium TaxID=407 RepID=UPI0013EBE57C|nr:polysaccharide deacetylase family protein [Methylobacterium sp. DB0501]NGM35502.1 polysaccharide deacetylase family protein [Methylobacterium sp. DB0501]
MRCFKLLLLSGLLCAPPGLAAEACGPAALGTARTLDVPFSQGPVGTASYGRTLPLERGEVVLTFDDGPLPRRTTAVLDALEAECVKATFFVVGSMVAQFPAILRRTAASGHTIATHTWSHRYLDRVRSSAARRDQINGGLEAARTVLTDNATSLSPFFRFPGLGHTPALDRYAAAQRLVPFSIDVDGDDWKRIAPAAVLERVMARLDAAGRGIILLHDIQPRTVAILPALLRRLKERRYRVVHVVPAPADTRAALAVLDAPQARPIRLALDRLGTRMAALRAPGGFAPVAEAGPRGTIAEDAPLVLRAGLFEESEAPAAAPIRDQSRAGEAVHIAVVAEPGPAPRRGWSGFVVVGAAPESAGPGPAGFRPAGFRPVAAAQAAPPR